MAASGEVFYGRKGRLGRTAEKKVPLVLLPEISDELKARISTIEEQNRSQAAQRRSMVRSGDRSENIRTYNFPQNRLTDHRIGFTIYSLDRVVDGDLDELIEQLRLADRAEKLQNAGA